MENDGDGQAGIKDIKFGSIDKNNDLEQDTNFEYDFSHLPEPIWVKVMEFLSLSDQYHVSATCHTLYDIFNHPTNWKSAHLHMTGGNHNYGLSYSFMADKFKIIVEKFGHFFQRLSISLSGHLVNMDESARQVVLQLSKVCRLEHLVLEIGILTSNYHRRGIKPLKEDLQKILLLVSNAFRLKKLEIVSWPMFPDIFSDDSVNVFEVMKRNPKLSSLESLSLFWMKNKQWSERCPLLPSPAYSTSLVSQFQSLQHLALRSPMLSNELFQELASSRRLKLMSLQILLMYSSLDAEFSLPDISSSSWTTLTTRSPGLEVECAIMSRIPDVEIAAMLRPEIPLFAIKILKFARCSPSLMSTVAEKFKKTLQSFICYHDPTDCGSELQRLAEICSNLNTLIFHGQIHCNTVLNIAKLRKLWKELEFVKLSIVTESEENAFDDDVVIGQNASGELIQVRLVQFHGQQSETEREQILSTMRAEVSKRVEHMGFRLC